MPGPGNVSDEERLKRLPLIDKMNKEGKTNSEIADKLGIALSTVQRNQKYLEKLKKADLLSEDIAEKRGEQYLELLEALAEVKKQFFEYSQFFECPICKGLGLLENEENGRIICKSCGGFGKISRPLDANRFHKEWLDTIEKMMKLYGLDNVKSDGLVINQQYNFAEANETLPAKVVEKIESAIIEDHEKRVSKRIVDDEI